jgi:3D (Asp-Asp-Asp) domain-containing protein
MIDPPDSGRPITMMDAGRDPECTDPPGSACDPIEITLPFHHDGDTTSFAEVHSAYACAPATEEGGPEVHYTLTLDQPRRVSFVISERAGVDVDVHVLRADDPSTCIARANTTLDQPLGAGTWRVIVDSFGADASNAGAYTLDVTAADATPRALGEMWNTFYFLADEDDHEGERDTPIYDQECNELARVRREFHDSVCIEGSGQLADDRIINYATTCTDTCAAALSCGGRAYKICYSVLDPERYPWGMGAGGRVLVPDRSIAIDRAFVDLGSLIYFEELDGLVPPGASAPHDGCMSADDVGGGIDGNQFDFFAGSRARWLEWEDQIPTRSTFHAWVDHPRCYPQP